MLLDGDELPDFRGRVLLILFLLLAAAGYFSIIYEI
jgi:hypothetical protein